jgi:hypothetical protein
MPPTVSNFQNFMVSRTNGDVDTTVFTNSALKRSMLLQLDICNTYTSGIQVTVEIYDNSATTDFKLVYNAPIPQGSTIKIIDGQKLVLEEDDLVKVTVNTPSGTADIIGSFMELS